MARENRKNFGKIGIMAAALLLTAAASVIFWAPASRAAGDPEKVENHGAPAEAAFVDGRFRPVISGTSSLVSESVVQPDGKILVAGDFKVVNGASKNALARFNPDGTLDASFNTGSGANDSIFSLALQSDGRIIVSGLFTNYNGVAVGRLARLNPDGSLDQTFNRTGVGSNANAGANAEVSEIKVLPNDKILVGGTFTAFNGTPQNRFARLNADGSLDAAFTIGTGAASSVFAIETQADGKILIGGNFTNYAGTPRGRLARLNADGSLDASFDPGFGAEQQVRSIVVQPDGKIVVAGFFTVYNNVPVNGIVRLNENATIDTSFNVAGFDAVVTTVARQPDGKLLVGGSFTQIAGGTRQCIARLNADGALDASFDPGTGVGPQIVTDITLQADGKAIVTGTFTIYNGTNNGGAIRVNANGGLDANLAASSAVAGTVNAIATQPDGKIVIGGSFTAVGVTPRAGIARLNADGTLDTSFDPGAGVGTNSVNAIAVQADGKILVGGSFTTFNGAAQNRLVRLNADGTPDASFAVGAGASGTVSAIAIQPADGKILIGGAFMTYNAATVNRLARLNADGTLDTSFATGTAANGEVRSIALQTDGKLLISGTFTSYNATARNRVARVTATGALDTDFNPGSGASGPVSSVAVQTDGKVVIGGNFTTFNATARNRVARLNADGTLDAAFDPGTGPGVGTGTEITRVLPVENGKTLIAGNFTNFNNLPRNRVARLNASGGLDYTFLGGIGALAPTGLAVRALVRQPDGQILIGGQFSVFNVSARTGLARFANASDTFADFDGDGRTDVGIVRRPGVIGPWTWWIKYSGSDAFTTFAFGQSPRDVPAPADYDGDGKDDVAMWRNTPAAGEASAFYIIQSATGTIRVVPFGQNGDTPVVEDYDGDGRDDLSVWRANAAPAGPGQATWFYLGSLNNPNNNITFVPWGMRYGTQADQVDDPYPGDFDGDGRADFRVQRRADITVASSNTPAVFHTLTAAGAVSYEYFGLMSDRIVPGDYDGDGRTDLGVVRGFNVSNTPMTWYLRYTSGRADDAIPFGQGSNFGFAQGDYDGDGATDIGLFVAGNFWWRTARDGSVAAQGWGQPGDLPIAGYNNR